MNRRTALAIVMAILCAEPQAVAGDTPPPNVVYVKQGFSMRIRMDNRGAFGRLAYPGTMPRDSLGMEYPIGSPVEHLFGAGIWVGGLLDTAQVGSSTPLRRVSTAYEGWAGPLYEFYPGGTSADTFWTIRGRGIPIPASWQSYWGNSLPTQSISDNDFYCTYTDTGQAVSQHIPMKLKIIQSSFVWDDPYAEAIQIVEYKIINMGFKTIDSVYVGFFVEGDIGDTPSPNYWQRNCTGYYPSLRTAYIHNPVDFGTTPMGLAFLGASRPLDSLRFTFRWYPGPNSPAPDIIRYSYLSSGVIMPDECPSLSDTRFLIGCGPFTIRPRTHPNPDTVKVGFALLSGVSLGRLYTHAVRARLIYQNLGGPLSVSAVGSEIPKAIALDQNYPNPFNPTTTIRFALPAKEGSSAMRTLVSLIVYDLLGREVATLVDDALIPGVYETTWNAVDIAGGVYVYRLQVGGYTASRKFLLLK